MPSSPHRRLSRRAASALLVTGGLIAASLLGTVSVAAAASGRATLTGSVPAWATSAAFKGTASTTANVGFRIYLGWQNETGAEALAAAVSNPRSASYGHYLSAAQFRQQFAPSQASVGAVQSWLRSQGFSINYTPSNNLYVEAEGTVAQAAAAFGTTFGTYAVKGMVLRSQESALTVPASLSGIVQSVVGLDETAALVHPNTAPTAAPPAVFKNAQPCSTYWDQIDTSTPANGTSLPNIYGSTQPYAPCGYTPTQIRGAYSVPSSLTGAGVTVAIVDAYASPTIAADVKQWSINRGIAPFKGGQFTQVVAPGTFNRPQNNRQDPQGWSGEETLDIEAVHGMAPDANVVYVGAPNNYQDLDAALNHVINGQLADMVTNSYGFGGEALPTGFIKPFNDIFIQAAAEGIGVYFSSGDNGDETGGSAANAAVATPDWPASSPWVTAVGGTSLAVSQTNSYLWETGWETGKSTFKSGAWTPAPPGAYLYGSGGGTSRLFGQPSYQAGVVPGSMSKIHGGAAMRVVPDVAAFGDPTTGYLIGQTQTFPDGTAAYSEYRIGGTSLSSPTFAGLMADMQQRKGVRIGFANPALYTMYQVDPAAFHDVLHVANAGAVRSDFVNGVTATNGFVYSFRAMDFTTGLTIHTVAGYDDVTGVGSINGSEFFK